jgi:hypothetical protein
MDTASQRTAKLKTRGIDFLLNLRRPAQHRATRECPEAFLAYR